MLEVCVDSFESLQAAAEGGAHRIELCAALGVGGLTPTVGLLKLAKHQYPKLKIFAMLRPYGGGRFQYSDNDMEIILHDMNSLKDAGADGFVFGALTENGTIDEKQCTKIKLNCPNLPLTFHRAFDLTDVNCMKENIKIIRQLGYTRLLTSGFKSTAELGVKNIQEINRFSDGLIIVPGSGINTNNVQLILNETKCKEFHSSAKCNQKQLNVDFDFGTQILTDQHIVKRLVQIGQLFL